MKAVQIYNYYIQSNQRNSGTETDITLQLPLVVKKIAKNSIFSIRANSLTVPFSFHQLSSSIAMVQVQFRDSALNTKLVNITLQEGNYNCNNVLDQLKAQLVTSCQISQPPFTGYIPSLTFSYSQTTNRSTFNMTGNTNQRIIVYFSQNINLGKFFGMTSDLTISPSLQDTSDIACVANPVNSLFLRSGNLKQKHNREWIVEKGVYSDIIYICPIMSQQNTYIQSDHQGDECLLSDEIITDINLYLSTNLTYDPINLNGLDWQCSITISEMITEEYAPQSESMFNTVAQKTLIEEERKTSQILKDIDLQEEDLKQKQEEIMSKLLKYKKRIEKKLSKDKEDKDAEIILPEQTQPTRIFS